MSYSIRTHRWTHLYRFNRLSLYIIIALLISACQSSSPSLDTSLVPEAAQPTPVIISTTEIQPTSPPSATPTSTATPTPMSTSTPTFTPGPTETSTPTPLHSLSIQFLREGIYPGSEIVIEETLARGANYSRYIASYQSEGLKIYALLTVPFGDTPPTGWPVIVFNHGYIPPAVYRTTERYIAYVDSFATNGYIVFRPDYRGHGSSEGEARGAYGNPDYAIDVLNAVAAIKQYPLADPDRIGMWGHSMGGYITLRAMVVDSDIKAGVIWAGVVGSYEDMFSNWFRRNTGPTPTPVPGRTRWRDSIMQEYGGPEENPAFWASLSANYFLDDLNGRPVQLHHGTADTDVPLAFSETLFEQLIAAGQVADFYSYEDDDHNISGGFSLAMQRSINFFNQYLKAAP